MASSGQITLSTQSVDYPCCPYGRGHITLTNVIGWSVNDNSDISFWSISSSDTAGGYWYICTSGSGYNVNLQPQVSYDNGASWVTLDTKSRWISEVCSQGQGANTISMSIDLINQLGTYHLTGNCQLRFLYYMTVAPAPDAGYKWAFPNESYSEAVQVPVHVDVSWTATLKYNANGGSGAPGDQTHSQTGNSYTFTVSNTVPTRTNYRFEGWATSSSASTPAYHGGDSYTINKGDATKTLYAVWTEFYRPGERKVEGAWKTHNRSGGACERKVNGSWVEMRTIDGGTGTNDPPSRKTSGTWYNQRKVGAS